VVLVLIKTSRWRVFISNCVLIEAIQEAQNKSLAASYLKRSADSGCAEAQTLYGNILLSGDGVARDSQLAAHYLKLAADHPQHPSEDEHVSTADGNMALVCQSHESEEPDSAPIEGLRLLTSQLEEERLGIGLLSGSSGRFDVTEGLAWLLKSSPASLKINKDGLIQEDNPMSALSPFSLLRYGGLLAVRVLVERIRPDDIAQERVSAVWREVGDDAVRFLQRSDEVWNKVRHLAVGLSGSDEVASIVGTVFTMHF
jgi:hypothetical protein